MYEYLLRLWPKKDAKNLLFLEKYYTNKMDIILYYLLPNLTVWKNVNKIGKSLTYI